MGIPSQNLKPYEIVADILNKMLRIDRAIKIEAYSQDVVDLYIKNTPDDKREIEFHVGLDAVRDAANNAKIITRSIQWIYADSEKTRKTSILQITELQNSLVSAMIEPYKTQCLHALLSPFNIIPMAIPKFTKMDDLDLFMKFVDKVSGALNTLGLIMENKTIDHEDSVHKTKITTQLTDLKDIADNILSAIFKKVPDHKLSAVSNGNKN